MTMNGIGNGNFGSLAAVVFAASLAASLGWGVAQAKTVKIELTAKEVDTPIDNEGHTKPGWTFDGQIPGPLLRATEGDTIDFTLKNDANNKNSHSVDFHAARTDVLTSFAPIKPGETKSYSFTADNPGIFFYHCGSDPMIQHIAMGMFGAVIIDPKDPNAMPKADREYVLVQSEMYDNPQDVKSLMDNKWSHVVQRHPVQVRPGTRHQRNPDTRGKAGRTRPHLYGQCRCQRGFRLPPDRRHLGQGLPVRQSQERPDRHAELHGGTGRCRDL